jgi:hypothetical protein
MFFPNKYTTHSFIHSFLVHAKELPIAEIIQVCIMGQYVNNEREGFEKKGVMP